MLMNSDELLLSINKRLQESGIINDVTDFFHEHPEYFAKTVSGSIVCNCEINIAMCCEPKERQDTNTYTMLKLGFNSGVCVELDDHTRTAGTKIHLQRTIG